MNTEINAIFPLDQITAFRYKRPQVSVSGLACLGMVAFVVPQEHVEVLFRSNRASRSDSSVWVNPACYPNGVRRTPTGDYVLGAYVMRSPKDNQLFLRYPSVKLPEGDGGWYDYWRPTHKDHSKKLLELVRGKFEECQS